MNVAFGMCAHSGWAALVALGGIGDPRVTDRRRIELVEEEWARQPYHAAENLSSDAAGKLIEQAIGAALRVAAREMEAAAARERARGNRPCACAVLVGEPMPDWSVGEILAVHFRMHKAEGVLFREVLVRAAGTCGLETLRVSEKSVVEEAVKALETTERKLMDTVSALGKSAGPPWGKDQKSAALAAMIALQRLSDTSGCPGGLMRVRPCRTAGTS